MEQISAGGEVICDGCWGNALFCFNLKITGKWAILLAESREKHLPFANLIKILLSAFFFVGMPWKRALLPSTWVFTEPAGKHQVTILKCVYVSIKDLNNRSWEASGLLFSNAILPWTAADRTHLFDPYIHKKTPREQNEYQSSLLLMQPLLSALSGDILPPADPSAGR